MKAADVMTRPVLTVTPDGTIAEAARLMLERHVSGLPVLDGDGKIVGMLTEGDLLRRAETGTERHRPRWLELIIGPGRLARDYVDTHARRIAEVMTGDVITVTPQTELPDLVQLMENSHIKRVPVVDCGRLVGIVSRADLVHAMLGILTDSTSGASSGDDEIRNRILGEISVQPWGPRANVDVIVKDGVVEFHGTIFDERERAALVVLAENVPGVNAVKDHLVWVEPLSGMFIPAD